MYEVIGMIIWCILLEICLFFLICIVYRILKFIIHELYELIKYIIKEIKK